MSKLDEKETLRLIQELKYDKNINGDDYKIIDNMILLYMEQKECNIDLVRKFIIVQSKLIDAEKQIRSLKNDNKVLKETLYGGNVSEQI